MRDSVNNGTLIGRNEVYFSLLKYKNLLFNVIRNNFQMLEMIGITYIPTKRFDQNLADSIELYHYVISSCSYFMRKLVKKDTHNLNLSQ